MKLRVAKEALITVAFIAAAVLVTYLATVAMGRLNIPALICFGLILVIAALCGIGGVGFLQKKGLPPSCLCRYTGLFYPSAHCPCLRQRCRDQAGGQAHRVL